MMEWFPLLLAVALGALGGVISYRWYLQKHVYEPVVGVPSASEKKQQIRGNIGDHYFRGINYLLNEQPDKALEVFLKLAEVTPETLETHLALGSLFRRRGEMDNAIRCHQNIIKQTTLKPEERNHALLELGEDYLRAGLLDRAEELFASLAENKIRTHTALLRLLNIFQQEREWLHAIHVAEQLERGKNGDYTEMIAQFYCELAEQMLADNEVETATSYLRKAQQRQTSCARVEMIQAKIAQSRGDIDAVIHHYQSALRLDPDCMLLILEKLIDAYQNKDDLVNAVAFLNDWLSKNTDTAAVVAMAKLSVQLGQQSKAMQLIEQELTREPTVGKLAALIDLHQQESLQDNEANKLPMLDMFQQLAAALEGREDGYQCRVCGLLGRTHHWHCPGCRQWNTTKPVRGILGQ